VESHDVRADDYISVRKDMVELSGTPALVVVGSDARIKKIKRPVAGFRRKDRIRSARRRGGVE
jgi:hypothetical protein